MVAMMPIGNIGRSVPRLEARDKVTGRAEYVHHLRLPGMLYGKIFRSTMPHARIKSVNVSAAKAVEGVFRVVTIDDIRTVIPHPYYGPAFHDQPILADGKVRFAGEPLLSFSRPIRAWRNMPPGSSPPNMKKYLRCTMRSRR